MNTLFKVLCTKFTSLFPFLIALPRPSKKLHREEQNLKFGPSVLCLASCECWHVEDILASLVLQFYGHDGSEGIVSQWNLHQAFSKLFSCVIVNYFLLFFCHPSGVLWLSASLSPCAPAHTVGNPARRRGAVLRDCAALGEPMASSPRSPSEGRRLRMLELLLGPLLVLLVSGLEPTLGQKVYTNTWAVHIPGGQEEADRIASKHGFINYGHVSEKLHFFPLLHLKLYEV